MEALLIAALAACVGAVVLVKIGGAAEGRRVRRALREAPPLEAAARDETVVKVTGWSG